MSLLVTNGYGENLALRRETGRALANMCRVLGNQRAILNYDSVWAHEAALAKSHDKRDKAVAADFYLYLSENETLPDVIRFCNVDYRANLTAALDALHTSNGVLTTRQKTAVAVANLSTTTPAVVGSDKILAVISEGLGSEDATIQRESVRAMGALCDRAGEEPGFVGAALNQAIDLGAIPSLQQLVQIEEVVVKCEAIKIIATMFKLPPCHEQVLSHDGVHGMLRLALSRDFVVKAEAVNSLGNIFANPACHPQLVNCGGLGVALSMATAEDALVAQKGIRLLDALTGSPSAHPALVRVGVLRRFKDLVGDCSEGLRAAISQGFCAVSANPAALAVMCDHECIVDLEAIAADDTHLLSTEALSILLQIAEMYCAEGQSIAAVAAVADLSAIPTCRSQIIDSDGFRRLQLLTQAPEVQVKREASRALANLMENADEGC